MANMHVHKEYYAVKKITGMKFQDNCTYYKIKWGSSWEAEDNLVGCQELINNFKSKEGIKMEDVTYKTEASAEFEDIADEIKVDPSEEKRCASCRLLDELRWKSENYSCDNCWSCSGGEEKISNGGNKCEQCNTFLRKSCCLYTHKRFHGDTERRVCKTCSKEFSQLHYIIESMIAIDNTNSFLHNDHSSRAGVHKKHTCDNTALLTDNFSCSFDKSPCNIIDDDVCRQNDGDEVNYLKDIVENIVEEDKNLTPSINKALLSGESGQHDSKAVGITDTQKKYGVDVDEEVDVTSTNKYLCKNEDREVFPFTDAVGHLMNKTGVVKDCKQQDNAANMTGKENIHGVGDHHQEIEVACSQNTYICNGKRPLRRTYIANNRTKRYKLDRQPFKCKECGKLFTRLNEVLDHQRIHTREKPYKCEQCGRHFALQCTLKNHKRTHSSGKPCHCTSSDQIFSEFPGPCSDVMRTHSCERKKHYRTQSGEKPYKCKECGKVFAQVASIARHSTTHTREKLVIKHLQTVKL